MNLIPVLPKEWCSCSLSTNRTLELGRATLFSFDPNICRVFSVTSNLKALLQINQHF